MRRYFFVLGVLMAPVLARAQVVVHQAALDQLAGVAALPPAPSYPAVVRHKHRRMPVLMAATRVSPRTARKIPRLVTVPVVARPAPGPPYVPAPPAKPAVTMAVAKPAPPLPVRPEAVVLRFAEGDDAAPGNAAAALAPVCAQAKSGGFVAIDAYAPADKSDPSAAMRLSLSRAFAVRDVLTACGVPAIRIIPRADGAAGDPATARVTLGMTSGQGTGN